MDARGWTRPFGLLAELTYRCPLRCVYCSNPLDLARHRDELDTADWLRVLGEAASLGVVQLHLTGGEPLLRRDLEELVGRRASSGLYTNLITSGIGLLARRGSRRCSRPGSTTCRSASRPTSRRLRPHRRHPVLRTQARGRPARSRSWAARSR